MSSVLGSWTTAAVITAAVVYFLYHYSFKLVIDEAERITYYASRSS